MPRLINAFEQFFDGSGNPLISGQLEFFESGSSTMHKNTFSDLAETVANPNPVILSADGRAPNIFGTGAYRVVLKNSSGTQLLIRDPVGSEVSPSLLTAVKLSDTSRSSTITPADDPDLALPLDADASYKIEGYVKIDNPGTSDGTRFVAIANQTGILAGSHSLVSYRFSDAIATDPALSFLYSEGDENTFGSSASVEIGVSLSGFINTDSSSPRTWAIQWAQSSSTTSSTILRAGSWITARRLDV